MSRPVLRAKLRNVKNVCELSPDQSEWWLSFGRHLDAARKDFDAIPTGLQADWWMRGIPTPEWLRR
jgi:hypothetical protein